MAEVKQEGVATDNNAINGGNEVLKKEGNNSANNN